MKRIDPIKPETKFRKPIRTKRNSLIIAVIIIVAGVATINISIKWMSGTTEYLVASAAVAAGTPLSEVPTSVVSLNLGEGAEHYLRSKNSREGLTLSHALEAGDLILKNDLDQTDPSNERLRVVVTAKNALPSGLVAGQLVDVWAAVNDGGGQFGQPSPIAEAVQVSAVPTGSALFADASGRLELSVFKTDIAPILSAVLHSDAISVVAHARSE